MATEIEHKYLVTDPSVVARATAVIHIRQGFLSRDKHRVVRVRVTDDRAFITIKGHSTGASRPEFEYEIPHTDGEELLLLCLDHIIDKTRHIVIDHGNHWEIDVYHGRLDGLVTAELELPNEDYTYPLPHFVGQDITHDPRYTNAMLSK